MDEAARLHRMNPVFQTPPETVKIAAVIPAYKVKAQVLDVIRRLGPEVGAIYVVDDACPQASGHHVQQHCSDPRVKVIFNPQNLGVGGATMSGYQAAIDDGCHILVKVDGDGQMAPELLPQFVAPILEGVADYTKGNRFYDLTNIGRMPGIRLLGNAMLSFMSKFSTGYWDIFDPTNGYTAIHARVASHLPFDKISQRYFFESDMLFRLNIMRGVVMDIPMDAHYAEEVSNLRIRSILGEFMFKHLRNFGKRIFYNYFLRDLSAASFHLLLGTCLTFFGLLFGAYQWTLSASMHVVSSAGTVMLAALPLLLGLQLLLAFISHDTQSVPRLPIHKRLYRSAPTLRQPERPSP
jgi:glycosyltransferase involved in cell wall biosynthesis